jgi:aryl-alcohol dehydrogenase-like predicted oxidoreductase
VGPIGLGSSFGLAQRDVEWAVDRGCNYLYWGSLRRKAFGKAMRHLASTRRDDVVFVVQSYARFGWHFRRSVESALKKLGTDYADVLLLGMWNKPVKPSILEAAERLRAEGKCRFVALSTHYRSQARRWLEEDMPNMDILHVRYNAAHRGAEDEIFDACTQGGPGVVAFTATRWATLLKPGPDLDTPLSAADCYRFALTHPAVDLCLSGPANRAQLEEAVAAAAQGPLDEEELARVRAVGDRLYTSRKGRGETTFIRR